jgi:hypothetical protein
MESVFFVCLSFLESVIYNNLASLLCRFKGAKLQKNPFRMEVVFRKNTYNGPLVVETPGKYDLYTFDGSQSHEEWRWHPEVLANGQGFLYADSIPGMANRTLSLTGTLVPSNDALSFDLAYTNTPFGAWNLVGNPFACNVTSSIDNFYVIDGTELVPASGIVAPLQGIFVMSTDSGQSVTFTIGTSSKAVPTLNISLSKADSRDGRIMDLVRIRFDESEDLEKLQVNPSHTKTYIPQNGKDYAVVNVGRDGVHPVSTMPINFKATEDGQYTLTVDTEEVSFGHLHLIDKNMEVDVDLLTNPSYTFTAKTTDDERRFKLVFSICEAAEGNDVKTKK